ncbi:AAA family ATPase [Pseudomonas sp. NCHU5208]|uniref:AAA family ATPase n=1 Tax=unclassified Pseudomonas TaxID=196821 RepID=UPI003F98E062
MFKSSQRQVVISGCSGAGKSTLLDALRRHGHATVEEPGRRVIAEQLRQGGDALPWADMERFLRKALQLAVHDLQAVAGLAGPVFFDRGLIDAAAALERLYGVPLASSLGDSAPYGSQVFLAPPWPAIYRTDAQRQHDLAEAEAEYAHLQATYTTLGYEITLLPQVSVEERVEFVLDTLHSQA